jgi:hypothetical protein
MKTTTMHSTQQKKAYNKPELNKIGNVASLTKAEKSGSKLDEITPASGFGNN